MASHVLVVHNDFERLAAQLHIEAEKTVADTANRIEEDMRGATTGRVAGTIKTQVTNGGLTATIYAGDKGRAFHAGFLEYGTVDLGARPFATPAGEHARPDFMNRMRSLLRRGF